MKKRETKNVRRKKQNPKGKKAVDKKKTKAIKKPVALDYYSSDYM